ncbi:hypothetical protein BH09ACT12_BH09ACT12_16010 [soil metagenome]
MTIRRGAAALLAASVLTLATGCSSSDDELDLNAPVATAPATSSTPAPAAPASEPSDVVTVPDLVGLRGLEARRRLEDLGLRATVYTGVLTSCLPTRQVVRTKPAAGAERTPGALVRVVTTGGGNGVCGLDLPAVTADLERVGRRFVDFAREGGSPPADAPVELFIGGKLYRTIASDRFDEPEAWQACPGGVGYAGRSCPISALTELVDYPGPIAITSDPPTHPCAHPTAPPERLAAYRSMTLTPDEDRDCSSWFGIQLFVNDVDQVVAVNVVLSEP